MKRLNDLEYLKLSKWRAFWYDLGFFFLSTLPLWFAGLGLKIWKGFKNFVLGIKDGCVDIAHTFAKGNWAVKLSFFVFGFGNIYYGQIMRGLLFLIFEVIFLVYMFVPFGANQLGTGLHWLGKANWFNTGVTVGDVQGGFKETVIDYNGIQIVTKDWVAGDDSVKVLLYALLTVVFIIAFIVTWRMQVKQCRICMDITATGKKIRSGKDDLKSLLDDQFHKTLLTPSLAGILIFTILPTIYMVLIAFTNYDAAHDGYSNLFSWVGLSNFNQLTNMGYGGLGAAFGEILSWTLIWAFFATFSNYFLGMMVAMMINKKGIILKKFWRTVLVMTIAIPQFVSLMYVAKLFDRSGIIGSLLLRWDLIPDSMLALKQMGLWENPVSAKILLVVINIWIGIPYIMLMATGILMNIPADLYESARVDGASSVQQFTKITLPYMLFVTGPYLLTSFVGNLNNFNVIYLLSGGGPANLEIGNAGGVSVGHTDLLITWLYKMTLNSPESQYYMASVIGILVFLVSAILSLIVYNVIPSTKNEEDFG
jgi:arabinogalactan oligomer/maltooligosaccharide transport system permease protein